MKKVAILGATGYVGEELVRLLYNHPNVELTYLSSHSYVGKDYQEIYGHFEGLIQKQCIEDDLSQIDADILFVALPHGHASKAITKEVLEKTKVIDLGADFKIGRASCRERVYVLV